MFSMLHLVQPENVEDAYRTLMHKRNNAVLGGCTFLRLGKQRIATAVDLAALQLRYIKKEEGFVEIGAMTTLRDLELDASVAAIGDGLLQKAVGNIIGVQFRNVATVGASVFSKYGFSDLLTALLALETEVELYKGGRMSLQEFIDRPFEKDILTKIIINTGFYQAAYQNLRNSAADFPILNAAVARNGGVWRIAVGARPGCAKLAQAAAAKLDGCENPSQREIEAAVNLAVEELSFGSNMRGSAEYRRGICNVLLRRAIEEVLECR